MSTEEYMVVESNNDLDSQANHLIFYDEADEHMTEDESSQDGQIEEYQEFTEDSVIIPHHISLLPNNADVRPILMHEGCEYFISSADDVQVQQDFQFESLEMINNGISEYTQNSNSESIELHESNYEKTDISEAQQESQEENSMEEDDLHFEEVEYLDYDNPDLLDPFAETPNPDTESINVPKTEVSEIKNIPITGINKITGRTITLNDFDDEQKISVNNDSFMKDGKLRLGKTVDGKHIIGIIKKIEKGNGGLSSSNIIPVPQENINTSVVKSDNHIFKTENDEDSELQYAIPDKNEYVDVKKIVMGLMKLETFEKTIGQKNLRIKYIIKSAVKGKIVKKKQTKLFLAQMIKHFDYDSYNNTIQSWRLYFRKGTSNGSSEYNEEEVLCAETVSLSIIVNVDAFGNKKTKVVIPNKGGPVKCTICGLVFRTEGLRRRHVLSVHTKFCQYPCDLCGKTYQDRSSMLNHRRSHSGDKAFKCEICCKSFHTSGSLKRHITVHNPSLRPHKCHECDHRFTDTSSLKKHQKIHKGVRDYQCNICQREFIHIGDLNFHQKIHDEVKPFSCTLCQRKFSRQANLHRHLEIHDNSGLQTYQCDYCPCTFKFASSLTRHIVTTHMDR